MENVHPAGFAAGRNPKESPPKGGICERRTEKYAAVTRDEGNAAGGRFPTASTSLLFSDEILGLTFTLPSNLSAHRAFQCT
jgi:hypothetical protein